MDSTKNLKYFYRHFPTLETQRLILRRLTTEDAKDMKLFTADESLYKYWGRHMTERERDPVMMFRSRRRNDDPDSIRWGIELKSCHIVVGEVVVFNIQNDRMGQVGYRLAKCMHSKGYCTEALSRVVQFFFEETELQRLQLIAMVENLASNRVAEKCGFINEGTTRQGKFINVYADFNNYAILKSDYEENAASKCPEIRTTNV